MARLVTCKACSAEYDATGYDPGVQFECTECGELVTVPSGRPRKKKAPAGAGASAGGTGRRAAGSGGGAGGGGARRRSGGTPPPGRKKAGTQPPGSRGGVPGRGPGRSTGGGRPTRGGSGGRGPGRAARGGSSRPGGRGGRGRGEFSEDERAARSLRAQQEEQKKMMVVVLSIVGGIAVVLLLLVAMNSGGGDKPPVADEGNSANKSGEDNDDPMERLKSNEAVQAVCATFWATLKANDNVGFHTVFDRAAWGGEMNKPDAAGTKIEEMGFDAFMDRYFSAKPDTDWPAWASSLTLTPTPVVNSKGTEFWYHPGDGHGYGVYEAASPEVDGPWTITLKLKLDVDKAKWMVVGVDDAKYKPWELDKLNTYALPDGTFRMPERIFKAHEAEYRSGDRTPPPPWDQPLDADEDPTMPPDGPGPGGSGDPVTPGSRGLLPEPEITSDAADDIWEFVERGRFRSAEGDVGRLDGGIDIGLSARLINMVIKAESGPMGDKEARDVTLLLRKLYTAAGFTIDDSMVVSPMGGGDRAALIGRWKDMHREISGG